jgi:glycerol-3-phosphate acyltransferase PlsY
MRGAARIPVLFVLSALLGTAGDQLHVRFGVLGYARGSPLLFGQAPWVPFLFGAAGVALVLGHAPLLRLREGSARASTAGFALSVLWFYAAYAATALLASAPVVLGAALFAAWGARVAATPTADKVVSGVLYAIAGPLFEAALSATGAFHYRRPDLLLVPLWLPALYLHVSLMTREAYLVFFGGAPRGSTAGGVAPSRS